MKVYKAIVDTLAKIGTVVACLTIAGIVVVIIAEVINRNVFNQSFSPTIEICGILFMYMTFFGLIPLFRNDGLLSLGFLYARLSGTPKHVLYVIGKVSVVILGAVMILSFVAMFKFTNTSFYATIPWLPYSFLYVNTAIAGVCMILIGVYQILVVLTTGKTELELAEEAGSGEVTE